MAIRYANSRLSARKEQGGFSLVELLVASTLGLLILASVGTVFISGQKLAANNARHILLTRTLYQTLNFLQRDIRRAGYNSENGTALTVSGQVLHNQDDRLSYAYRINPQGEVDRYQLVSLRGDLSQKKLRLCSKSISALSQLSLQECQPRNHISLFDENSVLLTGFSILPTAPGLLTVTMTVQLKDFPQLTETKTLTLAVRNNP
ncbi:prepilin-type N-terminal cleavage/methylation domain-containing protein [Vibrio sp. JC009]|uniref:prepilin-type N-terminal cleavage/methylation domain-containing protein n=1 Tax=Vibrio sp. JC009 TaxID=2912314 RepID=UPI0023AF5E62|nr:prepilin-type N-terminal cleavage/methylation domain-containing protein [Vibrio sp. JC009]WED21301.1 prepilin-type N-terminal cleavage/methylation domain-containing protein [Vibrio sp. JC009]